MPNGQIKTMWQPLLLVGAFALLGMLVACPTPLQHLFPGLTEPVPVHAYFKKVSCLLCRQIINLPQT